MGLEEIVVLQIIGNPDPAAALHQHFHGAVGQLQQLQDVGQHAHVINAVRGRIVDAGVDLARQQDLLVVLHHLFQRAHRFLAADEQRHDHVRKHHDIAQRQDRVGLGKMLLHALSLYSGKTATTPTMRQHWARLLFWPQYLGLMPFLFKQSLFALT